MYYSRGKILVLSELVVTVTDSPRANPHTNKEQKATARTKHGLSTYEVVFQSMNYQATQHFCRANSKR